MLEYEFHEQYQLAHRIQVNARLPNSVFRISGGDWFSIAPEVYEWLNRNIGEHRREWEFSDNSSLWFRTREQAMRFKLGWIL